MTFRRIFWEVQGRDAKNLLYAKFKEDGRLPSYAICRYRNWLPETECLGMANDSRDLQK